MSDELKLKPCPWCGSADVETWKDRALLYGKDTLSVIFCNQCGNEVVGSSDTVESAIAAWNALPRQRETICLRAALAPILAHADNPDTAPPLRISVRQAREMKEKIDG